MMNKYNSILIFLFTLMSSALIAQDATQIAGMQYDLGEYQSAINTFESIDTKRSDMSTDILLKYADAYAQIGELDKSINVYNILVNKDQSNELAYMRLAQLYRRVGDLNSSLSIFEAYKKVNYDKAIHGAESIKWAQQHSELSDIKHELVQLPLNTARSEYFPVSYNDKIVFSSNRRSSNQKVDDILSDQLFVMDKTDMHLGESSNLLDSRLQSNKKYSTISFSPDLSWALITVISKNTLKSHLSNAQDRGMRVYQAEVDENGNLNNIVSFPFNNMDYSTGLAHIAADGKTVFFASNRAGGYGGYDIYYTTFANGKWSKAQNLGSNVNSGGNEIAPFTYDDKFYFSSDYRYGYGGYDVFGTTLEYENSHPIILNAGINLGLGINSPSNDYGITIANEHMYLTSERASGSGGSDIYLVNELNKKPILSSMPISYTPKLNMSQPIVINKKENYLDLKRVRKVTEKTFIDIPIQLDLNQNLTPAELAAAARSENKVVKNIYSVQVAVVSSLNQKEIDRLQRTLGDIDQIYKIHFRDQIKIRVGSYDSDNQAQRTLNLVKAKGYTDAFIVTEQVIVSSGDVVTVETNSNEEVNNSGNVPFSNIGTAKYKVRLATYTNPKWFDKNKVMQYGNIQRIDRADWTIFLLGDYKTIEEAENIRLKAISAGFNQAQVVTLENGIPVKVKE